jgi:hypothetical protein
LETLLLNLKVGSLIENLKKYKQSRLYFFKDCQIMSLTQLFCDVDDFCETFIPQWEASQIESGEKKMRRKRCISSSEIITLIVYYHRTGFLSSTLPFVIENESISP